MRILVSNDDGIYAPGINTLAELLRKTYDSVMVVAPDRNRSGASNSLTLSSPLRTKTIAENTISVEGTPTDCVHIAMTGMLDTPPDLVVSGINDTYNLGDDVWYSGTVAAAMEGRFMGVPALAISLGGENNYPAAARVAKLLVEQVIADPLPADTILNVNVPDLPYEDIKGFEVTRLGTRHIAEPMIDTLDPRGQPIYWIGPPGKEQDSGEGTDFYAVNRGYVSITPLNVDITHYKTFEQIASWTKGLT
jgi:5'-nucleotidase